MEDYELKPDVLNVDDIEKLLPALAGKRNLIGRAMKWLAIDKCNWLHGLNYRNEGPGAVASGMLRDLNIKLEVTGRDVLDNLPTGAFITVSNHPFGALDGISLISLIAPRRPGFKVMVNMVLNLITGMRPNFIAVDALASNDPAKQAVSKKGIMEAIRLVKRGEPLGFFPAGAVSKLRPNLRIVDRKWQPSVVRIIEKCNVPVIPVYFHGHNSTFFNLLGIISWKLRTLRLPREVFRRHDSTIRVSIGQPISVEEQMKHRGSIDEFGEFLKSETYKLRNVKTSSI